jgi:hypothetical protein
MHPKEQLEYWSNVTGMEQSISSPVHRGDE